MIWVVLAVALFACSAGALAGYALGRRRRGGGDGPAASAAVSDRRLESLGVLAAGVVHEIAQPLSAARISIEGLHYLRQLGRIPSERQLAKTLDRVGLSLLAMVQILDHLRYLAGGGAARSNLPVVLNDVVAAVVADRGNWLRWSDIRIEVDDAERTGAIADLVGLRLIISNLVRNAAEAVAALPPERRWVRIACVAGTGIAVCDPGPGVAPELVEDLFQPYVSSRGETRGFGLSLARAAAERMGGALSYRRDALAGLSVFTLRLQPVAEPTPAAIGSAP